MTTEFKYKMLRHEARQNPNPATMCIISELEKQDMAVRRQVKYTNKEEKTAIAEKALQDKIGYSKLESKFSGWVYRNLQS